jgi:16S rRNA (cytosine1402-N4)-methyltransferase
MLMKKKKDHPLITGHSQGTYHVPVLLNELVEGLAIKPAGIYVDCTFGGGGHARAILERLSDQGRMIAFDQDEDAKMNLPDDPRFLFIPHNFRHLQRFLRLHRIAEIDGLFADLGVSSHQFDEAERGFSIRFDAPLDMRMDRKQNLTAADLLQTLSEQELHKVLEQFGEVTNAKTLARKIVESRKALSMKTINEFKDAVHAVVKGNPNKYFAQVFQALRIAVNDEMGALKEMLQTLPSLLRKDGRVAIITFHSIEDRIVKNFFKTGSLEEPERDTIYGTKVASPFLIITKKPIVPTEEEIRRNPRSRSAKLRIAQKK